MLQHKIFGIVALGVGIVEWVRRAGKLGPWVWSALLPGFALIGGSMLFSAYAWTSSSWPSNSNSS